MGTHYTDISSILTLVCLCLSIITQLLLFEQPAAIMSSRQSGQSSPYRFRPPASRVPAFLPSGTVMNMSTYESAPLPSLNQALAAPAATEMASLPPSSPTLRRSLRHPRPTPPHNVWSFSSETSSRSSRKRSRDTSSKPSSSSKRRRSNLKKPPPPAAQDCDSKPKAREDGDMKAAAGAAASAAAVTTASTHTCTICMCEPDRTEIASIDGCEHLYCFACIDKWSERENTCPNCKNRFTQIKRLVPQRRKSGSSTPSVKNTKKVKQRDQHSDLLNGAALESILANIAGRVAREGGTPFGRFRFFAAHVGAASRPRGRQMRVARMSSVHSVPSALGAAPSMSSSSDFPPSFFGLGSIDSDDEEDNEFRELVPPFMNAILRSAESLNSDLRSSSHAYGLHAPRSHATNADDLTAGRNATNPLEISDDGDDDDDEVEVIDVVTSSSSA